MKFYFPDNIYYEKEINQIFSNFPRYSIARSQLNSQKQALLMLLPYLHFKNIFAKCQYSPLQTQQKKTQIQNLFLCKNIRIFQMYFYFSLFKVYIQTINQTQLSYSYNMWWSEEEQKQLLKLFQHYGKSYTKISQHLSQTFRQPQKYTINRISSKIGTLMREGIAILKATVPNHRPLNAACCGISISNIVRKIMSLPNQEFFSAKGKLLALKSYKENNMPIMENDLKDIINLVLHCLGVNINMSQTQYILDIPTLQSKSTSLLDSRGMKPKKNSSYKSMGYDRSGDTQQQFGRFDKSMERYSEQESEERKTIRDKIKQKLRQIYKNTQQKISS